MAAAAWCQQFVLLDDIAVCTVHLHVYLHRDNYHDEDTLQGEAALHM
jgi:hypothetical protein